MGVTLITGASSGIGRSLALALAARGDTIVAVARRKELLDTLVAEITAGGGRALAVPCDVTVPAEVQAACAAGVREFGAVDRLVANAGGGERTRVTEFCAAPVADMLALNVTGAAHFIEALLPAMLARRAGHIVLMGSLAAARGLPGAAGYSAAKAALITLGESLRVDLAGHGIAVTLLLPGFVAVRSHKKKRPFEVPLDRATGIMVQAILERRRRCAFPWPLVLMAGLLRHLPAGATDWVAGRLGGPA